MNLERANIFPTKPKVFRMTVDTRLLVLEQNQDEVERRRKEIEEAFEKNWFASFEENR